MAPVLQGLGTALILAIVEQVRDRDDQTRAVALGEVRALQARMNPHFLFNALNTLAALATVAPREAPRAAAEQTIDPGLLKVLMPPFSFQPLVENAVQHGLYSSARAGRLQLVVRPKGEWLEMSVSDDGQGVPAAEIEHLFFAERPRVHALVLLRRRLQGLYGRSFQLEVRSEIGEGTTVTVRIPLRKRFGASLESPRVISSEFRELAPN